MVQIALWPAPIWWPLPVCTDSNFFKSFHSMFIIWSAPNKWWIRWNHGPLFRQNPFTFVITPVVKGFLIIILTMNVFVCVSFRQYPTNSSPQHVLFHCTCWGQGWSRKLCIRCTSQSLKTFVCGGSTGIYKESSSPEEVAVVLYSNELTREKKA